MFFGTTFRLNDVHKPQSKSKFNMKRVKGKKK